jgi:predicted ATPase/DNA-binding winged helix-turn-helix (wHTH) protein
VNGTYEFGPFRLRPEAGVVTRDGMPCALGTRGVAVLTALVEHANEYVSKASLMDAAWPGLVVEENNLAVQVSAIRHVLANTPGGERWVETLPRRGYRFVGPVTKLSDDLASDIPDRNRRSNLPEQLTSFVGRERELVDIKRLLPGKRLLTVIGVGGIGKTRVALQVAAEVIDAYRDGVWLVELASINDPALVPASLAQPLGVQEKAGTPLVQTLCVHLKSRKLLLILDNCEHLLEACAALANAVLRTAAQVTIIATSREPLHVAGEQTYPLPTLSLPDPLASVEQIASSEAVQLFVERAQRQQPDFALTAERAPAIAQLCVHLDGIPLALELAAARVRSLTVDQIIDRLHERFKLLTDGARTALPRQQTLRATLDWSYELLRDAEKTLLARTSVFSGGWTLEATMGVCLREGVDDWEVLDLLTSLANKSLMLAEERGGAMRYGLLETVRQYAWERLRRDGEEPAWQGRHLAYFIALAEEAELHLRGAGQQGWFERLEIEHDNMRSALAWSCAGNGDSFGGLRIATALSRFWYVRGYFAEGRGWLSALLAALPIGQAPATRGKALAGAGSLARRQGDYEGAWALHEASLGIWRELGDRLGIADSLNSLGFVATEKGEFAKSRALYEESLAMMRALDNALGIAVALNNLGYATGMCGDFATARTMLKESWATLRQIGDRQDMCEPIYNLGDIASTEGDYVSALALLKESLVIRRDLSDRWSIAESLEGLAYVFYRLVGAGPAARIWGGAERLRKEIGAPLPPREEARYWSRVATARASMNNDAGFDAAWQEGCAMTWQQATRYALELGDA